MSVTIGRHQHKLDPKNRLAIPPVFREALCAEKGKHFTLAPGIDGCIALFLPSQWENYLKIFDRPMANNEDARAIKREIFNNAETVTLDSQGRILIPQHLKEEFGLKKDVMIAGAGDKAEIWDFSAWQKYKKTKSTPIFNKVAKQLPI